MRYYLTRFSFIFLAAFIVPAIFAPYVEAAVAEKQPPVFIRFKVTNPTEANLNVSAGGFRHESPWYFPVVTARAKGGEWSEWIDLSAWNWHGKLNRSGGIAEYPSITLTVSRLNSNETIRNCAFEVQLAEQPDERRAIISFSEKSSTNIIAFLVPYPLRENAKDFETGSQMTARHALWAKKAIGGKPIALKKFDIITSLWEHYDPALAVREATSLKSLGFNVLGNVALPVAEQNNLRTYRHTALYAPDPAKVSEGWEKEYAENFRSAAASYVENERKAAHWVISDEVSALDFRAVEPSRLNAWFRAYLKSKNVTDADLGAPIGEIEYPAQAMHEDALPANASLPKRRLLYHAAKFGQWWSAKQLRQITDLIRGTLPGMDTETLLPSHGFLGNAWGAANIGMSYRMLDIFELGAQQSVSQLSAEDWLGLNRMYGANYTWTGGQTFGYYNAILRSAIGDSPQLLRGLITPSDDGYLRLKAHSTLAQGAKSFFFWTFGPTYIGTENYWSDLRSEYDGIAKLSRALEKTEDVLYPAKPITDPVAVLYSVSHDIWNTDRQAAFVEKRLLWHALRHLQIQPNFLREEDIETGKLKDYKVLYITDWCITRKASAAIDEWIKSGGVVYLSGGAATRDEFYEPFVPPFAAAVWTENAAQNFTSEKHNYNERVDLPEIKPLTTVSVTINAGKFGLPVIGNRLDLKRGGDEFAVFGDGKTAGRLINYGRGKIIAVGFMPMLAYGQSADFKPATLEEKWQPEPREIIKMALAAARVDQNVKTDVPVVEASLLSGSKGSAVVLANYTYEPIESLTIELKFSKPFKTAVSAEGARVRVTRKSADRITLRLPLKWTDIIILK